MRDSHLHGTLHATIFEVDQLCADDSGFFSMLKHKIEDKVGVGKGSSQIYATVDLEKARVGRTRVIDNAGSNLSWHESFHIYCAHRASNVIFTVKGVNKIGASVIGRAYVPIDALMNGEEYDEWVQVLSNEKECIGSKIHVKLQYFDVEKDMNWNKGIRNAKYPGVPYTYFSQRRGCKIRMYQDAHVPDDFIPSYNLKGNKKHEVQRCWEDIFDAIKNARHLIYITGWSVYTEIKLVRDAKRPKDGGDIKLGELLRNKADEGVKVLMLVWDDRTSVGSLKKDGLMATHDEDTCKYFEGTNVTCVLCPREPDDAGSIIQDVQVSTMFTHHQKIVVVDTELPGRGSHNKRRIMSFVGGLDLCDGRYDTGFHSVFRTLDNVHHDDFHQPNFPGADIGKGGPREPWHDIHTRLEGPIAWDVLFNFEQRWKKQGGKDVLMTREEFDEKLIPPSPVTYPEDGETWNVQLFRSIDGGAAFGFPESPEEAARLGLVSGKDKIIDRGIQDAYIHAIRRARKFIYIENQYFLGSSYAWAEEDDIKPEDINALHVIPKELSLKIRSKIEADERFTVYVVIPMWPEGVPDSGSVQAILDWQRRTMETMYKDIVEALRAKGKNDDPREYLTFYCLGNRETQKDGEYQPQERPEPDSGYAKAQEARRFMIYVHTKMMIVDDEYIIIGSANINQRSMDGSRDTEIAIGAYQPYHLATSQEPARGDIYGFRKALWFEHCGVMQAVFDRPESEECVQKMNQMADQYWEMYSRDSCEQDMPGHLMRYPIKVSEEGRVHHLDGFECFPDTQAKVLGAKSDYLPPILTT